MTVRYAVTLEFDTQPPLTHRGTISATTIGTCARRAIQQAQAAFPNRNWTSLVFCAIERIADENSTDQLAPTLSTNHA